MGGRGSSSSKRKGNSTSKVNAEYNGFKITGENGKEQIFSARNGVVFSETRNTPSEIYQKALETFGDVQSIIDRINSRGKGKAEIVPDTEIAKIRKKRSQEYEERGKYDLELGVNAPWGNKDNRKAARLSRLTTRISRRK